MCTQVTVNVWRSEGNLPELVLSYSMDSRLQVVGPNGKLLYLQSHLADPNTCFYTIAFSLQDSPRA